MLKIGLDSRLRGNDSPQGDWVVVRFLVAGIKLLQDDGGNAKCKKLFMAF